MTIWTLGPALLWGCGGEAVEAVQDTGAPVTHQDSAADECVDADGDGYSDCDGDVDDADPYTYPGSDAVDDDGDGYSEDDGDCNDDPDAGGAEQSPDDVWYRDEDGDGYGGEVSMTSCEPLEGYGPPGDLDDADPYSFPGAIELCDGVWNDHSDVAWEADEGVASVQLSDGSWVGIPEGNAGAASLALVTDAASVVLVCPGTAYVRLEISADDVTVVGQGADLSTLDASRDGAVLSAQGVSGLLVTDLTLTHGVGGDCTGGDEGCGGGLHLVAASSTIARVRLEENHVDSVGGGAWVHVGDARFEDVSFESNSSDDDGGGLGVLSADLVELVDCQLTGNEVASRGGGLYSEGESRLVLQRVDITENAAGGAGGIYVKGGSLVWDEGLLDGNGAPGNGGTGGGGHLSGVATTLRDVTVSDNEAWSSGGLYMSGSEASLERMVFLANRVDDGNSGGGLRFASGTLSLSDSSFSSNVSGYKGGGLAASSSDVTVVSSSFDGNEADEGGGVHSDDGVLVLNDVTFSANEAVRGGGLGVEGGEASVDDAAFDGNFALNFGGAVALEDAALVLQDAAIRDNTSAYQGGGISLEDSELTVLTTDFDGNAPEDVFHRDEGKAYDWGPAASFECTNSSCD